MEPVQRAEKAKWIMPKWLENTLSTGAITLFVIFAPLLIGGLLLGLISLMLTFPEQAFALLLAWALGVGMLCFFFKV